MAALPVIWKAVRNPWVLLAIACVIGIGGTGWYRMRWLGGVAARASDVAAAQQKVLKAQQADATWTAALEAKHAAEIDNLRNQANARNVAIATAPNSSGCVASQPMRAAIDGLRSSAPTPRDR